MLLEILSAVFAPSPSRSKDSNMPRDERRIDRYKKFQSRVLTEDRKFFINTFLSALLLAGITYSYLRR